MTLTVTIDGVNRTALVDFRTVDKTDNLDSTADILQFEIKTYTGQTYVPEVNDDIEVEDEDGIVFAGTIVQVDTSYDLAMKTTTHSVTAKDWGHVLDRRTVLERFEATTVDAIIAFLLEKYAPDFDDLYVDCPIAVTTITFNNVPLSKALDKLSQLTNYQWYVDYEKHVHFFEKNDEPAPFGISDGNGNYIPDTLGIKEDITQIRNRVTVVGGEREVNAVMYDIVGADGLLQDDGKRTFTLNYKFARMPVVEVNAVPVTVGVVGFDNASDFDAMWSFQEKYLEFSAATAPDDADVVSISGTPLEVIQVRVYDSASIAAYGLWDAVVNVPNVKSVEEAVQYAEAERDAYKDPQFEARFDTYVKGLRSGQVITINSTKQGVNEDFLIQRVQMRLLSATTGYWRVEATTLRQITIIDILSKIAGNPEIAEISGETLISFLELLDTVGTTDGAPTVSVTSGPYVYDTARWGFATYT